MELAPRDIVARAIDFEMKKHGLDHVWLDATHLGEAFLKEHFPTVHARCLELGIDIARQPIPVVPAAHYTCGGVVTDLDGRTDLPGLYAAGEVTYTGLHGANRLASNSLLEGLVFSDRVVRDLDRYVGRLGEDVRRLNFDLPEADPGAHEDGTAVAARRHLTRVMMEKVGVVRRADDLRAALAELNLLTSALSFRGMGAAEYELLNMLTLGTQIAKCALLREESRGVHLRDDFSAVDDRQWRRHITLRLPPHEREEGVVGKVESS
jgi:L-aspartate oxidase